MKSKYPKHLEAEYEKLLGNAVLRLAKFMIPAIRKELKKSANDIKTDADFTEFLNRLMDGIREKLLRSGYLSRRMDQIALNIQSWVNRQTINILKKKDAPKTSIELSIAGIENLKETAILPEFVKNFRIRNLELVKIAGNEYIDGIYQIAEQGFIKGESLKTMTEGMKKFTGENVNKAKFWARDQVGDAYAEYNRNAQAAAGLTHYRWNTVGDNKVRGTDPKDETSHVELNGKIFSWAVGAIRTGQLSKPGARHPGEDYNCRCWPEPVLPGEK